MTMPIVAVVGRPNVGKSTFVNRIAQADDAIVHEMRGVTRDRSYHDADWNGLDFKLVDTGGIEMGDDDAFQGSIRSQAFAGANEADAIVFLVDGQVRASTPTTRRLPASCARPTSPSSWWSTSSTHPGRAGRDVGVLPAGPGRPVARIGSCTATARETCSTSW